MLSGGKTPFSLYQKLATHPVPVHSQCTIFLSDERMVPLQDPNSNAGKLLPLLQPLNGSKNFIYPNTNLPSSAAAEKFDLALQSLKKISFGLLGMGIDGHTAGIFQKKLAQQKEGPLALSVQRLDGLDGITVTPPLIHRVKHLILLVLGKEKLRILKTLRDDPKTIPAGIILSRHPSVEVWTDQSIECN